ncbi:AlbA family DNA-binding domain-containing protein [Dyadobacter bucti]|uniref:AlbA family DNA-binding domain-containing protein n=1 Tax=Dyadobacter bucti TaxID=2572203 RepID=UPI003F6FF84E
MDTNELMQYLEGQRELQGLDYKADCEFEIKSLAKDIIAMSNVADGGVIVIGVAEDKVNNTFLATGVSVENLRSYKVDILMDKMSKYADPYVDLSVHYPKDLEGRSYVVIKIYPFKEIPTITKGEIQDELKRDTLYYRTTNKRVQSAPVSNSGDLRDILERAAVKIMQKRRSFGFVVNDPVVSSFDAELTGLPVGGLLATIKSKGYWELRLRPRTEEGFEDNDFAKDVVTKASISHGWDFPRVPRYQDNQEGYRSGQSYIEAFSDFGTRKEFWRMYKSGQFIDFRALPEDWYSESENYTSLSEQVKSQTVVNLLNSVVFYITDALNYLSRICQQGIYSGGVQIVLVLHNIENRELRIDDTRRSGFHYPRVTSEREISLESNIEADEVIENHIQIANEMILDTLNSFGFTANSKSIREDQDKYLQGRY